MGEPLPLTIGGLPMSTHEEAETAGASLLPIAEGRDGPTLLSPPRDQAARRQWHRWKTARCWQAIVGADVTRQRDHRENDPQSQGQLLHARMTSA